MAIELPVGQGPTHVHDPFRGVIDLVDMKFLQFDPETEGKEVTETEVPQDLMDDAMLWREQLLEAVCDVDEDAMELVMEDKEVPVDLIRKALRR